MISNVLILLVASFYTIDAQIPSYIKVCKLSDPNINGCLVDLLESIRPHFKDGIPELKVPKLDPLLLEKVNLKLTTLDVVVTSLYIHGISKFVLKSGNLDLTKNELNLEMQFPDVKLIGHYGLKGKLLMFDLDGEGEARFNLTDVSIKGKIKFDVKKVGDKSLLDITETTLKLTIKDSKMYLSDLFKGNQDLTDSTNQVLNENAKELLPDILPLIETTVNSLVLQLFKNVFATITIDV